MDPQLLRAGFRIGTLIFMLALVTLPFQPSGSAESSVTILAAAVGAAFLIGVALLARGANPSLPNGEPSRKGDTGRSTRKER